MLYRDILRSEDDVAAAVSRLVQANCDVVVLLDFDYDHYLLTLQAFARAISDSGGPSYRFQFSLRPNTGRPSYVDLDMDGHLGTPRDAQGYGQYSGQGGMAILSRFPVDTEKVEDYSAKIWAEMAWATLPLIGDIPFYPDETRAIMRLSTTGHWVVPLRLPNGSEISLLTYHASPPAFDGPEDRNGLRNADETLFWTHYLNDNQPRNFVIVGGANLDPERGDGRRGAILGLLNHPEVQDPFPNDTITVNWSDIGLGEMRYDYILPARSLTTVGHGAIWPEKQSETESRHALIWVDVEMPAPAAPSMLETSVMTQ